MPTSYPGGLDNFTNPTASDTLDSATVPHAAQHANLNDAVEAVQSFLGTTGSPNVARLASANAFTVGGHTITNAAAATVPLTVRGAASQSTDLQRWQDSASTTLARITNDGKFQQTGSNLDAYRSTGSSATGYNGYALYNSTSAAIYIMGTAGASETAFSVANSWFVYDSVAGAMRLRLDSTGRLGVNAVPSAMIQTTANGASTVGAVIRGAASQSANLQEWQGSDGTVYAAISPFGGATLGGSSNLGARLNLYAGSATTAGIILRGAVSQTANLQEWQNSAGSIVSRVDSAGFLFGRGFRFLNGTASVSGVQGFIEPESASVIPLILKGATSQTANLQEWRNAGDFMQAAMSVGGELRAASLLNVASFNNARVVMENAGTLIATNVATNVPLRVRVAASQTADALQVQDSGATVNLLRLTAGGSLISNGSFNATNTIQVNSSSLPIFQMYNSGAGTDQKFWRMVTGTGGSFAVETVNDAYSAASGKLGITNAGTVSVAGFTAASVGLIVKGAASQTANLQEWHNSSGTILNSIGANGVLYLGSGTSSFLNGTLTNAATARFIPNDASQPAILARGTAAQTANLQEWQNSAGSILARVSSAGTIISTDSIYSVGSVTAGDGVAVLTSGSSGGNLNMTRATAAVANPGSNRARLYFRDGTNAGTLKLVVRAGASGAETTILDNIPQ
jgi:hypothetical protein